MSMSCLAASSITSRVAVRVSARKAAARGASRSAVVRVVAADGEVYYKSMNVTKPNIVNNLDGETTRNIDGKVYTITVKGDDVLVKVGLSLPAAGCQIGTNQSSPHKKFWEVLGNKPVWQSFGKFRGIGEEFARPEAAWMATADHTGCDQSNRVLTAT
jgi:hypothetical protein